MVTVSDLSAALIHSGLAGYEQKIVDRDTAAVVIEPVQAERRGRRRANPGRCAHVDELAHLESPGGCDAPPRSGGGTANCAYCSGENFDGMMILFSCAT